MDFLVHFACQALSYAGSLRPSSSVEHPPDSLQVASDSKFNIMNSTTGDKPDEPSTRHIELPFDLRADPSAFWDDGNRDLMRSKFPGNITITRDGFFLQVYQPQSHMPPQPLPLTMGGVPLYFLRWPARTAEKTPMPDRIPVPEENGSVVRHINGLNMVDWSPLFETAVEYFHERGILVTEVMYWESFIIVVVLEWPGRMEDLPRQVANINCHYLFEGDMGRSSPCHKLEYNADITKGGGYVAIKSDTDASSRLHPGKEVVHLRRPIAARDCERGDPIFLSSPTQGRVEGIFMATSYQRLPHDACCQLDQPWVFTSWCYMGQGSAFELQDDMAGTPIVGKDGGVLGFFRYAPATGQMVDWCSVTAFENVDEGFTLVDADGVRA